MWLHRFKFKKKLVYSHPKLVSFAPFFFIFFFNVIKPLRDKPLRDIPLRDIPKNGCEGDWLKTCVFPIDVSLIFRLHQ